MYLSLTFDDGYKSHVKVGKYLNQRSLKATFFISGNKLGKEERGLPLMNVREAEKLAKNHEIGGHTYNHVDLSRNFERQEIDRNHRFLRNEIGVDPHCFAYPYGESNEKPIIMEKFHFRRTTDRKINSHKKGLVHSPIVSEKKRPPSFRFSKDKWLILNFHNVGDIENEEFDISWKAFKQFIDNVKSSQVEVVTFQEMLNQV